jgi:hypothetical protein
MMLKKESPLGKELRKLVIAGGGITGRLGQPPHPLVTEDLAGVPGGWTLGEELVELTNQIRERIRDLSGNLAVFSEELGVPIPKTAVELVGPPKEGMDPVLPKGLLTGVVIRLREISSLLEADTAILYGMQGSLTGHKDKPTRD